MSDEEVAAMAEELMKCESVWAEISNYVDGQLDAGLRQDIWLICKEAINNIVKYSECTNALLNITWENKLFCIHIEDNGKGFNADQALAKSRSGLKNMRERTEKYRKGIFKINSCEEKGTMIDCCIPVKNNPKM